ncbi:hypothetical protein PENSPDRAFT_695198 [Peniophora sp. CONT]|nr:hypothetical protein PENSPDRAFT_695198 [Peniophora sp. CONT]
MSSRAPRKCIRVAEHPPPQTTNIPTKFTLDYFDVDFCNECLVMRDRAHYVDSGVTLPLVSECGTTVKENLEWSELSDNAFMEKFGYEIREQYNVPTEEELAAVDEYDADKELPYEEYEDDEVDE